MSEKGIFLKYTGGGYGGSAVGIPARDLTAGEVEAAGGLKKVLATGLYLKVEAEEPEDDEGKE